MKLSDMLKQGAEILEKHGDLDVIVTLAEYYEGHCCNGQKLTVRPACEHENATPLVVEFDYE
jgi:hypothetical protein